MYRGLRIDAEQVLQMLIKLEERTMEETDNEVSGLVYEMRDDSYHLSFKWHNQISTDTGPLLPNQVYPAESLLLVTLCGEKYPLRMKRTVWIATELRLQSPMMCTACFGIRLLTAMNGGRVEVL